MDTGWVWWVLDVDDVCEVKERFYAKNIHTRNTEIT